MKIKNSKHEINLEQFINAEQNSMYNFYRLKHVTAEWVREALMTHPDPRSESSYQFKNTFENENFYKNGQN